MMGADQFACANQRGVDGCFAFADMPLHVFHHHDRIVYHQTDREHDRQQCQQVQREAQ